jgi:hypothetical protein
MKRILLFCFLLVGTWSGFGQVKAEWKPVVGTWEGDSTCTVPNSPCHDEHVLYRVKPAREKPDQLELEAFKVVEKRPQFMGSLQCDFKDADSVLKCTGSTGKRDIWTFNVSGDTMSGTLETGKEKTLYRKIELKKK